MDKEPVSSKLLNETSLSRQERIRYFDKCYADLHQAVYGNIIRLVQDPALAEDILQDVFLAFWQNADRLDPDRVVNWLFVVSFNKSMNSLKKLQRHSSLGGHPEEIATDEMEIDEEDFERKLQLIDRAVDLLSDRKKQIFRMYRLEGKSLQEISSEMQLSVHTIKDHLKITHKLIRAYLDKNHLYYTGAEFLFLLFFLK